MQLYASSDHRELKMKLSFLCVLLFSIYFVYGSKYFLSYVLKYCLNTTEYNRSLTTFGHIFLFLQ